MADNSILNNDISRLLGRWRETEAKVSLYGPSMPQAKQIIEDFYHSLEEIFAAIPSFSIVKTARGVEIVTHDKASKGDYSHPIEASDKTVQSTPAFEKFNIQSITFKRGITLTELEQFFCALHMSPDEAKKQNGLAGYLEHNNMHHIELDKLHFELLKEGAADKSKREVSLTTEKVLEDLLKQTQRLQAKKVPIRKKAFSSTWESYLSDQLDASDFKIQHPELIALAQEKPEILIRALQHMAAKQVKIEAFLANLERKLFDVGFPENAVASIKNELLKPKKVLIDEDELARLRQIEKNHQPNLAGRIEKSLQEIETLQGKLSDERERGDAIIRQSSQGVMVLNKDGQILELNPIAQKVLGVSPKEAKGKLLTDVIKDHHMLSVVSGWEAETETHIPKHVEIQAGNDDVIDTIRESAIVIENENGRSIGGVSALHDVVKHNDLEKRKNDILDVLGHDLRAPLNIVKQNISLIADFLNQPDKLPLAKQVRFLDACQRHIDRMEKLINKILDMRQLETGKIVLQKDNTNSNKVIEDAAHSLDSWAKDKNITIEINTDPLPDMYCDPERIYQVITNLVSNALKFTPEGGCIKVNGKTVETEGSMVVELSVKDSGVGINKEDLERIFNKYEQVSLQRPVGVSGLGLGLYTCKTIIEMHDGRIWANSIIGKGSTFTFQIPISTEEGVKP